jgi:HK97 family phage prohead protease
MQREIRMFSGARVRVRAKGAPGLEGLAAPFNSLSVDMGGWRERILPGAFTRALREGQDVRALVNHNPDRVLGRTKSGTLSLAEDPAGLRFSVDTPDTEHARALLESIRRGDMDQCSFGFICARDRWTEAPDPSSPGGSRTIPIRELQDLDLWDVSVVTYPSYPATSVDVRSFFLDGIPEGVAARMRPLTFEEIRMLIDRDGPGDRERVQAHHAAVAAAERAWLRTH